MFVRVELLLYFGGVMEGSTMDDKWIREMAEGIRRDVQAKKLKDEKFVETQKLKRQLGPSLWSDLKQHLNEACGGINKEMASEVALFRDLSGAEVSVTGQGEGMYTTMTVKFSADRSLLEYESQQGNPMGKFEVAIGSGGHANFTSRDFPIGQSAEDVAREIMRHALRVSPH